MQDNISIELTPTEINTINAAIQTIQTTLEPHLVALDAKDKSGMAKMGDKSAAFVGKALDYMKSNPEFIPNFVDAAELDKDYKGFTVLNDFLRPLAQITDNLEDTAFLCGSDTYRGTLNYYDAVKQAAKMNVPNAKAIYEDLKVRFEAQKAKTVNPAAKS